MAWEGCHSAPKHRANKPHFPHKIGDPFQGFFRRWFVIVYLFSHFIRIGEAVPGPAEDSFLSHPFWTTPPDFCLGVGNPGGIANKHHMFEHFPLGWWRLTETQAFDRLLRSCMGHPAPLRSNSATAGSCMHGGVKSFGDCPIRQVPCVWLTGLYTSGRIDLAVAHVCGLEIAAPTVYCPPRGKRHETCRRLCFSVTEQLVYGRSGPRVVLGDFNCPAGSLVAMKHWISQGWVELQSFLHHSLESSLKQHVRLPHLPITCGSRLKCSHLLWMALFGISSLIILCVDSQFVRLNCSGDCLAEFLGMQSIKSLGLLLRTSAPWCLWVAPLQLKLLIHKEWILLMPSASGVKPLKLVLPNLWRPNCPIR